MYKLYSFLKLALVLLYIQLKNVGVDVILNKIEVVDFYKTPR